MKLELKVEVRLDQDQMTRLLDALESLDEKTMAAFKESLRNEQD